MDASQLERTATHYPCAKRHRDFRETLDKEQKNLHGITITIPDHRHASVALWAMERGIAVYCQKPLTQEDVSWIKNWGKGRVFYTNLGHGGNHAGLELENTPVLEHILLGIQWALGDLKNVDATPKGTSKKNR